MADFLGPLGADKARGYRNLNDLADAGLLRRTEFGDHHSHPHLLCVDCGAIRCLEDLQLSLTAPSVSNNCPQTKS